MMQKHRIHKVYHVELVIADFLLEINVIKKIVKIIYIFANACESVNYFMNIV